MIGQEGEGMDEISKRGCWGYEGIEVEGAAGLKTVVFLEQEEVQRGWWIEQDFGAFVVFVLTIALAAVPQG